MGKDLNGVELGEGLSQRKDGRYSARFMNRFGKRVTKYSTNLVELKKLFKKETAENMLCINAAGSQIKLGDWFKRWLNYYKGDTISIVTKENYCERFKRYIAPRFGNAYLDKITAFAVTDLINDLGKRGLSKSTQKSVLSLLVDMLGCAFKDGFIKTNVATHTKIVHGAISVPHRSLSKDEQREFFLCSKNSFYYNLFELAVFSGLRVGELTSLTIEDIDLEKKIIIVNKTLSYLRTTIQHFAVGSPKSKASIRDVPLNKYSEQAILKQIEARKEIVQKIEDNTQDFGNLLFVSKKGMPLQVASINYGILTIVRDINRMRKEAGDTNVFEKFTMHTFRHTFATRCFENGIQPRTVQAYLGHSDWDLTMNLYTHVLPAQKQKEMEKLNFGFQDDFSTE